MSEFFVIKMHKSLLGTEGTPATVRKCDSPAEAEKYAEKMGDGAQVYTAELLYEIKETRTLKKKKK